MRSLFTPAVLLLLSAAGIAQQPQDSSIRVRFDGIAGNGLRARSVNAIGERRRNEDAIVKNEARTGNFNCVIVGLIRPRESREILSTSSPFGLPEASV